MSGSVSSTGGSTTSSCSLIVDSSKRASTGLPAAQDATRSVAAFLRSTSSCIRCCSCAATVGPAMGATNEISSTISPLRDASASSSSMSERSSDTEFANERALSGDGAMSWGRPPRGS
eukprot:Amastigsp_a846600_46.p7 type:complete len:118 gc:universal Amastigsp_a846600_46:454-101(-)